MTDREQIETLRERAEAAERDRDRALDVRKTADALDRLAFEAADDAALPVVRGARKLLAAFDEEQAR